MIKELTSILIDTFKFDLVDLSELYLSAYPDRYNIYNIDNKIIIKCTGDRSEYIYEEFSSLKKYMIIDTLQYDCISLHKGANSPNIKYLEVKISLENQDINIIRNALTINKFNL